jgi:hypothetical protein
MRGAGSFIIIETSAEDNQLFCRLSLHYRAATRVAFFAGCLAGSLCHRCCRDAWRLTPQQCLLLDNRMNSASCSVEFNVVAVGCLRSLRWVFGWFTLPSLLSFDARGGAGSSYYRFDSFWLISAH